MAGAEFNNRQQHSYGDAESGYLAGYLQWAVGRYYHTMLILASICIGISIQYIQQLSDTKLKYLHGRSPICDFGISINISIILILIPKLLLDISVKFFKRLKEGFFDVSIKFFVDIYLKCILIITSNFNVKKTTILILKSICTQPHTNAHNRTPMH